MDFQSDQRGFTGTERALLVCFGLALVSLVGSLISQGSTRAAGQARQTLVTKRGGGRLQQLVALLPSAAPISAAGTQRQPGPSGVLPTRTTSAPTSSSGTSPVTVQPGDSLSAIAERELGDGSRWREIYELNREVIGDDPGLIQVGMQLQLPGERPPPPPPVDPGGGQAGDISLGTLQAVMPNLPDNLAALYIGPLNAAMREYGIDTPQRQAAFLAQIAHESIELTAFEELASGDDYEGWCSSLGNCQPGDGRRYKGRGPIQLTGRANYRRVGGALGLDLEGNPELAATPEVGFRVAGYYWQTHGLNELADQGDFREITRRINGGYNGAASREMYWRRARSALGL